MSNDSARIHELEQQLSALRTAVRSAAHELSVWSADVLGDDRSLPVMRTSRGSSAPPPRGFWRRCGPPDPSPVADEARERQR